MPPVLAKLTRPRLFEAVARARLFQALDRSREHPVVWISGPPGAGKTTFVASYINERETPGIWYQLDSGDGDPATFFYYMGLAVDQAVRGKHKSLPLLTDDSLPDLMGFGRRFARELITRLPAGATIVFDNVHEIPHESSLTQLLEVWAEEIPDGINLLCMSRGGPPASLMRQVATGRVSLIDWDAMRLTLEETRQIAAVKHKISDQVLARLHAESEGWAAGLTLMLERIQHTGDLPETITAHSREGVFSYFAGTLFDRQPADVRHVLLCTALLPRITPALATQITGNPSAGQLLDSMHRRHLFTHRRNIARAQSLPSVQRMEGATSEPVYEYHALFREFLLERLAQDYTYTARRRLAQDVALLLEQAGYIEDAFELNRLAEDWEALARLLIGYAPNLLRQGRGQTLREWIALLPENLAVDLPYTQYWLGVSLVPIDQSQARGVIEKAFHIFASQDDRMGQLLCAARIIEANYRAYLTHRDQDEWIGVIDRLLDGGLAFPSREAELTVHTSLALAAFYRQPRHARLESSMNRIAVLLREGLAPEQMMTTADALLRYYALSCRTQEFEWIVSQASAVADDPFVAPLNRLYWWGRVAEGMRGAGLYAQAQAALSKAEGLAEYCPGHPAWAMVGFFRIMLNLAQRNLGGTTEHLNRVARAANPVHPLMVSISSAAQAIVGTHSKPLAEALHSCRIQVAAYAASGPFFAEIFSNILLTALLAQSHPTEELSALLTHLRARVAGTYLAHTSIQLSIIEAYAAIQAGQADHAKRTLSAATRTDDDTDFLTLTPIPRVLPTVFAFGLAHGIGTARIRTWIKRFTIPPEGVATEHWPWHAIIFCMGKFSISVEGEVLQFKGRVPSKPLELLKLLITAGPAGLPARVVADQLWPDAEGDAALVNVDTNVHRLRKIFKQDPLRVREGRVSINTDVCWVDAWALERLDQSNSGVAGRTSQDDAIETLRLYKGHFLDLEAGQAWAIVYRKKLQSSLVRQVLVAGKSLEQAGRTLDAIALYERASQLDTIAEPVYRQWITCLRDRGEQAEALKVYRRCKEMLSIVLGVQPSPQTEAIARSLKG